MSHLSQFYALEAHHAESRRRLRRAVIATILIVVFAFLAYAFCQVAGAAADERAYHESHGDYTPIREIQ